MLQSPFFHHDEEDEHQDEDVNSRVIMPPRMGAAIGFITSEPIPELPENHTNFSYKRTGNCASNPPSTRYEDPVRKDASSLNRNAMTVATSSGRAILCIG
jgi:hypothetical protein